jgi:SAM-dependent methyltransferase
VPFGSPLRKCITASVEYHLRNTRGQRVLEIGCGSTSHAKQVVEASGGSWVGLDPLAGELGIKSVRTVGGVVQKLPFQDGCFDVICGVQTLEHWEDRTIRFCGLGYQKVLDEVWRVLKSGGWIYLDAPIHQHGAPEFIRGDLMAIRKIFQHRDWRNLRMLSWRRLYQPLRPRRPPQADRRLWPEFMPDSNEAERAELAKESTWIIAIRAEKPVA